MTESCFTIFEKSSIIDVWQDPKYTSEKVLQNFCSEAHLGHIQKSMTKLFDRKKNSYQLLGVNYFRKKASS